MVFAVAVEEILHFLFNRSFKLYPFSAITTSIGIMLMIYSSYLWLYLILIFFSLLQKYLIKIQNHHLFNPSNFAILIILLFFNQFGAISNGTLGHNSYLLGLVLALGIWILIRVDRWIVSVSFFIFYTLFELLFIDSNTILVDDFFERFLMVSFIVFVFFMLTDPATTPKSPIFQTIFAILVALFSAIFDRFYGVRVEHTFLALSLVSPLWILFEKRAFKEIILVELILIVAIFFILSQPIIYIGSPD